MMNSNDHDVPTSVEEAAALLGAAITKLARPPTTTTRPPSHATGKPHHGATTATALPKGMPSAFATIARDGEMLPSMELWVRLQDLSQLLHHNTNLPLLAAPSVLQVLHKLMGISVQLAPAYMESSSTSSNATNARPELPPLWSTLIRTAWVDCVTTCFAQQDNNVSVNKQQLGKFVQLMLAQCLYHPRSAKAGGGLRVASWQVLGRMLQHDTLAPGLLGSVDQVILQAVKALRSAGQGEPTYRIAAVQAATSAVVACRNTSSQYQTLHHPHPLDSSMLVMTTTTPGGGVWCLPGVLEDRAIQECGKLLKQATSDKFPEVREAAARLAQVLAPLTVPFVRGGHGSDVWVLLDDFLATCWRNMDDASPHVATLWAEAMARGMLAACHEHQQLQAQRADEAAAASNHGGGPGTASGSGSAPTAAGGGGGGGGPSPRHHHAAKRGSVAAQCTSVSQCWQYLVVQFFRVGGELVAARNGGPFSMGGRHVRVGIASCLMRLLKLQARSSAGVSSGAVATAGDNEESFVHNVVAAVLNLVGPDFDKQIKAGLEASSGAGAPMFGGRGGAVSRSDSAVARQCACHVLRQGVSEMAAEPRRLLILQRLTTLLAANVQDSSETGMKLNVHQQQVALIEISHLIVSLGQATASKKEEMSTMLCQYLASSEHGVRHEAALALDTLTTCFPMDGLKLLKQTMSDIQLNHGELVALGVAAASKEEDDSQVNSLRMFRRQQLKEETTDLSLPHQHRIQGATFLVALLMRSLPAADGGLPIDVLASAVSVSEILLACQFNEVLAKSYPAALCTCVRGGCTIASGYLTTGPTFVAAHVPVLFGAWKKTADAAKGGTKGLAVRHDLFCLDFALSSICVFLKYCSELLLSVPDALSQVALLLEEVLPLLMIDGRLASTEQTPAVVARLECARASLMEAFAWLPSGSFPMAAENVFSFAAQLIHASVESDVTCSILHELVEKEDSVLDVMPLSRAVRHGQVGGACDLEEMIVMLTADCAHPTERESIFFLASPPRSDANLNRKAKTADAPTALHEVGQWRRPIDPSSSSKIRLVDAAVQAFSATFGLKSGADQQEAMDLLESLMPPLLSQLARAVGMNTSLVEPDRRSKTKEDVAAVANITAVLLSCLKSLPLHEATHNVPIGLGPPWMNKAKDLLLTLLPSESVIVRRAAAEGLSLLATLGVSEDGHILQSTVLHSLDAVMQGNKPDGKPKALAFEPVSAARSGSLLTLACIQRTARQMDMKQAMKQRARTISSDDNAGVIQSTSEALPLLQMLTRVLPSTACCIFRDYFGVRVFALHSYIMLISYSGRVANVTGDSEINHLVSKAIEIIEENMLASWSVATAEFDRAQEGEKIGAETSFACVVLRAMSVMIPILGSIPGKNFYHLLRRFAFLAASSKIILGDHPAVSLEATNVLTSLAQYRGAASSDGERFPWLTSASTSTILVPHSDAEIEFAQAVGTCHMSFADLKCTCEAIFSLCTCGIDVAGKWGFALCARLMLLLEVLHGKLRCTGSTAVRQLACPRRVEEQIFTDSREIVMDMLTSLLMASSNGEEKESMLLRWILFAREILSNSPRTLASESGTVAEDSTQWAYMAATRRASKDCIQYYAKTKSVSWQVRCVSARLLTLGLDLLISGVADVKYSLQFDPLLARSHCQGLAKEGKSITANNSLLVFHLTELVGTVCMAATATVDQAEVFELQQIALHIVKQLAHCFGGIDDPEAHGAGILEQYVQQILSTIKHGLDCIADDSSSGAARLFSSATVVLEDIVRREITSDATVLKRLIRPCVPAKDAMVPLRIENSDTSQVSGMSAGIQLIKISQLATLSALLVGNGDNVPAHLEMVVNEFDLNRVALSTHCASLALDAAHLLWSTGLSLNGIPVSDEDLGKPRDSLGASNLCADEFVKARLVSSWSSLASCAVRPLLERLPDKSEADRDFACAWLDPLTNLLLQGLVDGLRLSESLDQEQEPSTCGYIESRMVMIDCLRGLTLLLGHKTMNVDESAQINHCLILLQERIQSPILRQEPVKYPIDDDLVMEYYRFVEQLAVSDVVAGPSGSHFWVTVLSPLEHFAEDEFNTATAVPKKLSCLVQSCLVAVKNALAKDDSLNAVVQAMIELIMGPALCFQDESVREVGNDLLHQCLAHASIDAATRIHLIAQLAKLGHWSTWAAVSDDIPSDELLPSLEIAQQAMSEYSVSQLPELLAALLLVLQRNRGGDAAGMTLILHYLGGDVLSLLQKFGTADALWDERTSQRQVICGGATKFQLLAYQRLASTPQNDPAVTDLLTILLETLVAVIKYNGLPNHAAPQPHADPGLGRLCAQAILHTARTTPAPFKAAVARLPTDAERTVLEVAMRGEMSGYRINASNSSEVKRKISLQGFKKG